MGILDVFIDRKKEAEPEIKTPINDQNLTIPVTPKVTEADQQIINEFNLFISQNRILTTFNLALKSLESIIPDEAKRYQAAFAAISSTHPDIVVSTLISELSSVENQIKNRQLEAVKDFEIQSTEVNTNTELKLNSNKTRIAELTEIIDNATKEIEGLSANNIELEKIRESEINEISFQTELWSVSSNTVIDEIQTQLKKIKIFLEK